MQNIIKPSLQIQSFYINQEHLESNIYVTDCKNGRKIGTFDIMNNISEHFTLLQLMDSLGNVNNAVSVVGMWIFDPN